MSPDKVRFTDLIQGTELQGNHKTLCTRAIWGTSFLRFGFSPMILQSLREAGADSGVVRICQVGVDAVVRQGELLIRAPQ